MGPRDRVGCDGDALSANQPSAEGRRAPRCRNRPRDAARFLVHSRAGAAKIARMTSVGSSPFGVSTRAGRRLLLAAALAVPAVVIATQLYVAYQLRGVPVAFAAILLL